MPTWKVVITNELSHDPYIEADKMEIVGGAITFSDTKDKGKIKIVYAPGFWIKAELARSR